MSEKTHYRCDVCGHSITEGHQQHFMGRITIQHQVQIDDGSCAGTEEDTDVYHVHNDFSNHCLSKVWDIVKKDRN